MAELQEYNHAAQIDQLDEQAQSAKHEDDRLKQIATAAKAEVNKVDPDGLTDLFGEAGLDYSAKSPWSWRLLSKSEVIKADDYAEIVRGQVMAVLGNAGARYESSLSDEAYAPNLERLAWQEAQTDVLGMIEEGDQDGLSSLRTADGYITLLKEAKAKTDTEWKNQKTANQKALEKMTWWQRQAYYRSPKHMVEKFNTQMENELKTMFAELDGRAQQLKTNAEARVKAMAERVQAMWDGAIDPDDKEAMWDEIVYTAEAPDLASVPFVMFPLADEQEKIDFAEALLQLPFVKEGLGITEASEKAHDRQKGLLDDADQIETDLSAFDFTKYKTIADALEGSGVEPQVEKKVSTADLVTTLTEELSAEGEDVEGWFSAMVGANLHTDSSRLMVIVQNIDASDLKSLEAKQAYANWHYQFDTQTSGGLNTMASQTQVQFEFNLLKNGPDSVNSKLKQCVDKARNLTIQKTEDDFKDFRDKTEDLTARCQRLFDQFEHKKATFPDKDREILEKLWEKINARVEQLKGVAPKWLTKKREYLDWEAQNSTTLGVITQAENELVTSLGPVNTDLSSALAAPNWTGVPTALQTDITTLQADLASISIGSTLLNGISTRLRNILPTVKTLAASQTAAGTPNTMLNAIVASLETNQGSIALKEQNFGAAQATAANRMGSAPSLTDDELDLIGIEAERQSIFNQVNSLIRASANPFSHLRYDDRFKSQLLKDFTKEVETAFLKRMEENDQYDLLEKCAEGTTVHVEHKIVAGVQHIRFPQQLRNGLQNDDYRVVRKIPKQGILLEKVGTNETITILGKTVSGGKPHKNAIVANIGTASSGGANAIVTNLKVA